MTGWVALGAATLLKSIVPAAMSTGADPNRVKSEPPVSNVRLPEPERVRHVPELALKEILRVKFAAALLPKNVRLDEEKITPPACPMAISPKKSVLPI